MIWGRHFGSPHPRFDYLLPTEGVVAIISSIQLSTIMLTPKIEGARAY